MTKTHVDLNKSTGTGTWGGQVRLISVITGERQKKKKRRQHGGKAAGKKT